MKLLWASGLVCGILVCHAQIADPTQIVLRQSQNHQFSGKCPSGHTCQFELLPGHDPTSSITSDGLYTAPSRVERHGSIGGCPVLPHNSIYNMRVDGMPVHPDSVAYVGKIRDTSSFPRYVPHFGTPGIVPNLLTKDTPKFRIKAYYTPAWNGDYYLSTPATVAFGSRDNPKARVQSGWGVQGVDRHYIGVVKETCEIEELYNMFEAGRTSACPDCTALAAARYPAMGFANPDGVTGRQSAGSVVAMGGWLAPLELGEMEMMKAAKEPGSAGVVRHALAVTVPNAALSPKTFAWPGTKPAYSGWGIVPYGTRLRLKASFVEAYDPAADTSDPVIQAYIMLVLRTLQQYGMFVMDGTAPFDGWGIHMRSERIDDPEIFKALSLFTRSPQLINNKLINALEAVDESGYRVSAASDVVRDPAANPETVVYRDATTGAVLDVRDLAIHPPTIGATQGQYNVVAGAPPIDLSRDVFATGLADNTAVAWSVSAGGGSISPAGLYTPPDNVPAATSFTVRAAAVEDPSVYVDVRMVVYPAIGSGLYVRNSSATDKTMNLKEGGRAWWSADTSGKPINASGLQSYGYLWTYNSTPMEPARYPSAVYSSSGANGEQVFSIYLPNGRYRFTALVDTNGPPSAQAKVQVELNGAVVQPPTRFSDMVLNASHIGIPVDYPVTVSNGELVVGWKWIMAVGPEILGGFVIQPDTSGPHLEIPRAPQQIVLNGGFAFSTAGFGMDSAATWSVAPAVGSMDANTGVYTAPWNAFAPPQPITITATSVADPSKTASVTTQLAFGNLTATVPAAINRSGTATVTTQLNGGAFDKLAWTASPVGQMAGNVYQAPHALDADTKVSIRGTVIGDATRTVESSVLVRAQPVALRIAFGPSYSGSNDCGFTDPSGNVWTCYNVHGAYKAVGAPGYTLGPNSSFNQWTVGAQADFGVGGLNRLYQNGIRTEQKGSSFQYIFPGLPAGRYTVALHFGTDVQKPTSLNIDVNGVRVATNAKLPPGLVAQRATYDVPLAAPGSIAIRIADGGGYSEYTEARTLLNGIELVPVAIPAPSISYFTAQPQFIEYGDKATLQWATAGATTVQINSGVGPVQPNGSADVSPDQTTDYLLTAENERGKTNGVVRVYVYRRANNGQSRRASP